MAFYDVQQSKFNTDNCLSHLLALRQQISLTLISQLKLNQLLIQSMMKSINQAPNALKTVENEKKPQNLTVSKIKAIRRRKIIKKKNSKQSDQVKKKQKKIVTKNDTKNIPKNYGKAILSYIQNNSCRVKNFVKQLQIPYQQLMLLVRRYKSKINTIADMRSMWGQGDQQNKCKKCLRILSYQFMRKHCLMYIFNSRVKNFGTHIKYRTKIIQGIQNPAKFRCIKEY